MAAFLVNFLDSGIRFYTVFLFREKPVGILTDMWAHEPRLYFKNRRCIGANELWIGAEELMQLILADNLQDDDDYWGRRICLYCV
jgi:hypothetical protein